VPVPVPVLLDLVVLDAVVFAPLLVLPAVLDPELVDFVLTLALPDVEEDPVAEVEDGAADETVFVETMENWFE
jgi:hypothetical protein